jgi:hypothetical protein
MRFWQNGTTATFIRRLPPMVFVYSLVILLELEESVQRVPTICLLENTICQRLHRSTYTTTLVDEKMCKENPVQVQLAYYRGLLSFFDSLPCESSAL